MTGTAWAAAVILAHTDPAQVARLCGAMRGVDLFLHCDLRTPQDQYRAMGAGAGAPIHLVPRLRTTRSSWSLVNAELQGLRMALDRSSAEHIVVMSGSCYPLLCTGELEDELGRIRGSSRLQVTPLPHPGWNTRRNQDGGYWRFRRRFVVIRDQTLHVGGIPIRTLRRQVPPELVLHGGSQWKIYARAHVQRLLTICDHRPDLLRFFRHSFIPDESCIPTILQSPKLVGAIVDDVQKGSPWYVEWPADDPSHPRWLTAGSLDTLLRARAAAPEARSAVGPLNPDRPLFARKVRSTDSALLDRIDAELRC